MESFKIYFATVIGVILLSPAVVLSQDIVAEDSSPEEITSGYDFTEGPFWHPDGYLLFSNIPGNTIQKWTPGNSESNIFMSPSGHSNGITSNPQGEIVLAQHDGMISKVDNNKNVVVLARSYEGKRLNSPNDLVVSSDGIIYFTDPPFGVSDEERKLEFSGVYMLKENEGLQLLYKEFDRPNGIVLSPDEAKAYVNNSSDGSIIQFDRSENGELTNPREFANVGAAGENGAADGMAVDTEGRVYSTGPGGFYIYSPEGKLVQKVELPARATNLAWGGTDYKSLYITTPSSVYRLKTNARGAARGE